MARALWKGAISFGLVYIPVELYPASRHSSIDLDLLDKRDFAPVGYQRFNKRTGKVVEWGNIVKGYEYEKGRYVALTDEDFKQANVKASHTVEILSFTDHASITPEYFETPYYLAPGKGGEKVYALLREALRRTNKVAVATIVIRSRQHLAVLLPCSRAILLNTIRFAEEIAPAKALELPPADGKSAGLTAKELSMAEKLVEEMTAPWEPEKYRDTYRDDLLGRVREKVRQHKTHSLTPADKKADEPQSAEIIDLMSVLRQSLERQSTPTRKKSRSARQSRTTGKSRKRA